MVTPQLALTMNTKSNMKNDTHTSISSCITSSSSSSSSTHKLNTRWNLWAHLPQDTDWSVKSYKLIYNLKTLEDAIVMTETTPDPLIKACMLFVMKDGMAPMWEDPKNRN